MPLNNAFYHMQVNLIGSLRYFYTVTVIKNKI